MDERVVKSNSSINLSKLDAWAMAFGCMVGWGAFVMPGTTFLPLAGPLGTIAAMAVSTVIMLVIGYNFAFLMNRNPGKGGVYMYANKSFGRDHAFLSSWFLCLSYLTNVLLNGTALFVVLRTMLGDSIQTGISYKVSGNSVDAGEVLISVIALAGVGFLFIKAKNLILKIHSLLAITMLTGIAILAVICIPHAISSHSLSISVPKSTNVAYGVYSLIFLAPWAFVGFDVISFDTADFRFDIRKSKRILFTAIIVAGLTYVAMAVVSISSVPDGFSNWTEYFAALDGLKDVEQVPTFYSAKAIMGKAGLIIIGISALAGVLTGIIGGYRITFRILSTMAEDKILPDIFTQNAYGTLFILLLLVSLALLGRNNLSWFVDLTSFGAIAGYGYTSACAYRTARAEGLKKVMFSGILGTVISIFFVIVQLVPRMTALVAMGSEAFLLLSLWCLIGFVFYWRAIKRSSLAEYGNIALSGVALFALLIYSAFLWLAKQIYEQTDSETVRSSISYGGIIIMIVIFTGLTILIYIQNLVRKKQVYAEREKIRAMESSLAKSRFLFNMSHDIRTPMNAIIGYTELALKEPASEEIHGYLVKIQRSNQHLLTLINDILEMSRIESGKMELECIPADICSIFDDISDLFEEQMKKKHMDFCVDTSGIGNRYVWCDVKNLNRVILNLLSNAYKFTPENGRIHVTVSEKDCDSEGYCGYEIHISDNGIGMSSEFAEKMFSPFERERTSTVSGIQGTGLGLAITKSIIDLMDGTIDVRTSPGNGTDITLLLELKKAEESDIISEEKSPDSAGENIQFAGKRILLAEDNEVNLEIATMILTQAGFIVEPAENGKIAVEKLAASEAGYYDALLMDVQMPVMDGFTAAKAIRSLDNRKLAATPIIAMTANAFKEDAEAAFKAGMQAHVAKPVNVDILLRTLSDVLSEKE